MQAYAGAEVIINISASPYHTGKGESREKMIATRASDTVAIFAYNNLVGGQDELVFDGHSLLFDESGNLIARGKQFEEDFVVADLDIESVFRARLHDPRWRKESPVLEKTGWHQTKTMVPQTPSATPKPPLESSQTPMLDPVAEVYRALVLGTRDYIHKNGFEKVVIGLSGGVDSALVATIAVDALEKDNVIGISMPSRYSSTGSVTDTKALVTKSGHQITDYFN